MTESEVEGIIVGIGVNLDELDRHIIVLSDRANKVTTESKIIRLDRVSDILTKIKEDMDKLDAAEHLPGKFVESMYNIKRRIKSTHTAVAALVMPVAGIRGR